MNVNEKKHLPEARYSSPAELFLRSLRPRQRLEEFLVTVDSNLFEQRRRVNTINPAN